MENVSSELAIEMKPEKTGVLWICAGESVGGVKVTATSWD